jgi:hypothetical protein
MNVVFSVAFCLALCATVPADQSTDQKEKAGTPHDGHMQMKERGEKGMGFSQTATTHHFFLTSSGGVIQVEANDSADTASRDTVRMHLRHIGHAFQNGDFDIPMFVHETVPPGVPEMRKLRKAIHYIFKGTPKGGRVVITSTDKEAIIAVHRYLKFQIKEHETGDQTKTAQ